MYHNCVIVGTTLHYVYSMLSLHWKLVFSLSWWRLSYWFVANNASMSTFEGLRDIFFLLATCIIALRVQLVAHIHVQRYMYCLSSLARCGYSCASTFHHSNRSVVESWLGASITTSIHSCCWCFSSLLLQNMSEPSLLTRWLLWCVLPLLRLFHFHFLYFLHYMTLGSKKVATSRSSFNFLSEYCAVNEPIFLHFVSQANVHVHVVSLSFSVRTVPPSVLV